MDKEFDPRNIDPNIRIDHMDAIEKYGLLSANSTRQVTWVELLAYLDKKLFVNTPNLQVLEKLKAREEAKKERDRANSERMFANQCLADLHDEKQKVIGLTIELEELRKRTEPMLAECKLWADSLQRWSPFYHTRRDAMKRAVVLYETGDWSEFKNDD